MKECKFYFDESCPKAFGELKEKLVSWGGIVVMCNASEVAVGVVL